MDGCEFKGPGSSVGLLSRMFACLQGCFLIWLATCPGYCKVCVDLLVSGARVPGGPRAGVCPFFLTKSGFRISVCSPLLSQLLKQMAAVSGVSQRWCQPAVDGGWGWITGWMVEGAKVSQSWCCIAGGPGQGPDSHKATITLLVFRLVPHMAGCRTTVVLSLMSAC